MDKFCVPMKFTPMHRLNKTFGKPFVLRIKGIGHLILISGEVWCATINKTVVRNIFPY